MADQRISSIGDFLKAAPNRVGALAGPVWYRGQADASWSLKPGYTRRPRAISESSLISRFRQSAAMLTDRLPRDEFDWLFLMQHYGVPTRLLDWSESPLVALYFALNDVSADNDVDAALWCLSPTRLNKHANIVNAEETTYIPSFEDEELQGYTPSSVRRGQRLELFPVATIATRNNARIQAQSGTFTIHHQKDVAIEEIGGAEHILKYRIPAKSKLSFASELHALGVNRFSLFPELSSVGSILSENLS